MVLDLLGQEWLSLMLTVSGSHRREPTGLQVFSISVDAAFIFLLFSCDCESFFIINLFIYFKT